MRSRIRRLPLSLAGVVCGMACFAVTLVGRPALEAAEFFVSAAGADSNPGTAAQPFATLARAQQATREARGGIVTVRAGTYYLPETFVLEAADSGTEYRAAAGQTVVFSGGRRLELQWQPYRDGSLQAGTPPGLEVDQLFINGVRQHMARYPNYDENARPYNGAAADAFSKERAARWSDPAGGYIHAMHSAHWGGYHYRITGKNEQGEVTFEGGWQNNRQMGMHPKERFVEHIFEELDAPGEWFHDRKTATLYCFPMPGVDLPRAVVEVVRLRHLVEFRGSTSQPVKNVVLRGFTFRHAARTFMDTREPLLRSDWTVYRGGAVRFDGAEDCTVADCAFDQLGGNAVFVNNYNRRIAIRGCDIHNTGATAVAFVGDPKSVRNPLFEYNQRHSYAGIDKTPGPLTDNYPADCLVEDCLLWRFGVVEKQATGVEISMAQGITVRHCSIYEGSRAGINISEGTFGGHVIEFCDVFDTVRETGDHGSFNSWGRDRFWGLKNPPEAELPQLALLDVVKPIVLRNNRWRCDHGWDVDLDDGSSNYEIYNNLFLNGGLKLREGFHRRVWNNITVNNTLHPHVWFADSRDVVTNNIFMGAYRPAGGMPKSKWGSEIDRNLFTTSEADRTRFAANGCDAHSLVGDALFVDPAQGDYRVREGSPALELGFVNFPMDQFGVRKPELKAIARTPELPTLKPAQARQAAPSARVPDIWLGASIRAIEGEEFSAFGVSRERGGVHLTKVPPSSLAAKAGLREGDLIQGVNGQPVKSGASLFSAVNAAAGAPVKLTLVRSQTPQTMTVAEYVWWSFAQAPTPDILTAKPGQSPRAKVTFSARPAPANGPASELGDGKLTADYGPVFANQVTDGRYKADLGGRITVGEVRVWSYRQAPSRAPQRFTLFGSNAASDPGWNTGDAAKFTPIATVDTAAQTQDVWQVTTLQAVGPATLGEWRWLVWAVQPPNGFENTSYQEIEVAGALR
jgi:membrane-associated protease RseP (regulator of RpoE activity)